VNDDEIARMAAFLGIGETDFIERYTRLRQDRKGLSLVEKPNFECVFLDGINCRVQPVKPAQCDGFPNRWNFPGFEKECRSKPREVGADEYQRLINSTPQKHNPHS
jgi:Fe-S-cluster containining protein